MTHLASGGRRSPKCPFKSVTLPSSAGVLSCVICLHVDEMLGTWDDLFKLKLRNSTNSLDSVRWKGRNWITAEGSMRNIPMEKSRFPWRHTIRIWRRFVWLVNAWDTWMTALGNGKVMSSEGSMVLAMGNKGVALPMQFVVKVLQQRQGQARVRDLIKANEVIDEIKQHEDFTLTHHVLDLTSCGLIGVSDASLGGVVRFGYPTDQDSKKRWRSIHRLG